MNPLTDALPPRARAWLYLIATVALFVWGLWQAAGGDWAQFAVTLGGALVTALAGSNVSGAGRHRAED